MLHSKLWEWHDRSDAKMFAFGYWRFTELCSFRHLRCCVCISFFCFSSCFVSFSPFFLEALVDFVDIRLGWV